MDVTVYLCHEIYNHTEIGTVVGDGLVSTLRQGMFNHCADVRWVYINDIMIYVGVSPSVAYTVPRSSKCDTCDTCARQ